MRFVFRQSLLVVLLTAALRQGYGQLTKSGAGTTAPGNVVYRGGMLSPPLPKPKFTLTDTSGAPFDLASQTQGYTTLLFFGFTNCPDMCPTQMHTIAQAIKKIPPETAKRFKVIFVTTDPARDSPKILRAYLDHFDKTFTGLTGSQAAIDSAQIATNISPATKSASRSDGTYDVGHAAFVLAYTTDNLAHLIYPVGITAEDLAHDLLYLANETWGTRAP